jgi:site-specific recombinase XerD
MIDLNQVKETGNEESVKPVLAEFLTDLGRKKKTMRTLKAYRADLVKFFDYVKNCLNNLTVEAITSQQVEAYMH